ncbi:MAG TPA: septum site-determining protein MinC [Anaerolineales bacterium]|nr:septum site-determining protein MinC [Anaerolineales bacterium]
MARPLPIKGIRDGLLVTLPDGPWEQVRSDLLATIDARGDFFRGARLSLQMEDRSLGAADLGQLRDSLAERETTLWAVLSSAPPTQLAAADLGLKTQLTVPRPAQDDEAAVGAETEWPQAVFVQRTLRSGQSVRTPGNVVVLGDVNPGAEIVAGGHVVIWGRLRGVVHAGAAGDDAATVAALDLAPTQLRIAGHIAVSPQRRGRVRPEVAVIRDGHLVAEPWEGDSRR